MDYETHIRGNPVGTRNVTNNTAEWLVNTVKIKGYVLDIEIVDKDLKQKCMQFWQY